MKTRINGIELEGTVDEIRELLNIKIDKVNKVNELISNNEIKKANKLISNNENNRGKHYTRKEKQLIKELYQQNKSIEKIADIMKRPIDGIRYIMNKKNILRNKNTRLSALIIERNKLGYKISKEKNISYSEGIKAACEILKNDKENQGN